jgi:hypothetical protein
VYATYARPPAPPDVHPLSSYVCFSIFGNGHRKESNMVIRVYSGPIHRGED